MTTPFGLSTASFFQPSPSPIPSEITLITPAIPSNPLSTASPIPGISKTPGRSVPPKASIASASV